jgi:DNA invertase Pin-like site-specific DNA recombinase
MKAADDGKIDQATGNGAMTERPVLADAPGDLRPAGTLVVWRLDRRSRSLRLPNEIVSHLAEWVIGFTSLTQQIETTMPGGYSCQRNAC